MDIKKLFLVALFIFCKYTLGANLTEKGYGFGIINNTKNFISHDGKSKWIEPGRTMFIDKPECGANKTPKITFFVKHIHGEVTLKAQELNDDSIRLRLDQSEKGCFFLSKAVSYYRK